MITSILIRHRKENLQKCTLRGLESRTDCLFLIYPRDDLPPLSQGIILSMEGAELSLQDSALLPLILIDGTWDHAKTMARQLPFPDKIVKRRLPDNILTAYPRRQTGCSDPLRGLASIEALYAAFLIMGLEDPETLLSYYHWKKSFLELNRAVLEPFRHPRHFELRNSLIFDRFPH